jgi:hypothetical protein
MAPGGTSTTTYVNLNVANASPGGLHPWEAHLGQCGTGMGDGVFGPSAAYKPLRVDSDGRATGTATVRLPTPESGRYFVVVHASVANPQNHRCVRQSRAANAITASRPACATRFI